MPKLSVATGARPDVAKVPVAAGIKTDEPKSDLPVELRPETYKSARRRPNVVFPKARPIPDPPADLLERMGKRLYRHPDGSLQDTKPPPNPYTVAARRAWHDLCTHARLTGGDKEATEKGISFRYGIGVSKTEHTQYLQKLGMESEVGADGHWKGFDKTKINPLDDPAHPLHNVILSEHHRETFPPYTPYRSDHLFAHKKDATAATPAAA